MLPPGHQRGSPWLSTHQSSLHPVRHSHSIHTGVGWFAVTWSVTSATLLAAITPLLTPSIPCSLWSQGREPDLTRSPFANFTLLTALRDRHMLATALHAICSELLGSCHLPIFRSKFEDWLRLADVTTEDPSVPPASSASTPKPAQS